MKDPSAQAADSDWHEHFGLDRDPFEDAGVHGLFYPGGARQETVQQLLHLARYSDCVLLVTGVAGAGKSTTRRHFVAQATADTRCAVIETALLDGPEQWLRRVLAGFGHRATGSPDFNADLQLLVDFCAGRAGSGGRNWLIIDDAHDLHGDVIAVLPRLLQATGRNLRVALFAEPRWRAVLQASLPPAVPLHTIELQPFEAGETHAYLHYRLNTAGLDGELPFNPPELARIHSESGGLPGRINEVARTVLQDAATVVEQPLNALPLWHFGVIAVTLFALLLLYAWGSLDQDAAQPVPKPSPQAALTQDDAAESVPEIQIAPVDHLAQPQQSDGLAEVQAPPLEAIPDLSIATLDDAAEPGPSGAPAGSAEPVEEPVQAPDPGEPDAPSIGVDRESGPAAQPAPAAIAESAPPPPARATSAPAAEPVTAPKSADHSTVEAVPVSEFVYRADGRAGGAPTADEQHLLGLDPGRYVLQVMASDDGGRVRAFAARTGGSLRVYRKLNGGREWYALVQGEYPSRAAAEAALKALPPSLRDTRPWVRRIDAIQKEIRAARAM